MVNNPQTDSYRLFYSEGDELPGLTCDVFGNCASVHITSEGMEKLRDLIVKFLKNELKVESIFIKTTQNATWVTSTPPLVTFQENDLKFISLIESGQKTGYFLDQRDNRQMVSELASGRVVLDAFCYLGGFGLHALKGGAKNVTFLDASKLALEHVEKNVQTNFKDANYSLETADCFEFLRKMEADRFDLIILDPPAFAKRADFVSQAARGYKDINMTALKKIKAKSLLFTFSCSQHISRELFRTIVYQAALDAGRSVRIIRELGQASDHPTNIYHPEGDYLKGLVLYVD
jgi:23S rRNA (cytosine1962-C5)-methyltransferase